MTWFFRMMSKANPYHDKSGLFASKNSAGASAGAAAKPEMHQMPVVNGGKVNTGDPTSNEYIAGWGDDGTTSYSRVQMGDRTFVVAGGHTARVGDKFDMRDDGNATTPFSWKGSYDKGLVTHFASKMSEMKAWPKGRHSL